MRTFVSIFVIFLSSNLFAQIEQKDTSVFSLDTGEIMEGIYCEPQFPGGEILMMKYIEDTLKYPQLAMDVGILGIVYVQFIVNKDGSISDVQVLKSPHEMLNQSAIDAISSMPNWNPAVCAGKAYRVRYVLPINYNAH